MSRAVVRSSPIDWLAVWLAAGIAFYFWLDYEPDFSRLFYISATLSAIAILFLIRHRRAAYLLFCIGMICLGTAVAGWHSARVDSPFVPRDMSLTRVVGEVISISPGKNSYRIVLEIYDIESLPDEETPRYIRVNYRGKDIPNIGDIVSARAMLFPPSPPVMPHSFDFGRYFFFREIGAVGLIFPPINAVQQGDVFASSDKSDMNIIDSWLQFWSKARLSLQQRFLENMRIFPDSVGIAIALTTGDKSMIDSDIIDAFRAASLSHMLAVSGLHMAIICGLFFVAIRYILASIPALSFRINVKKLSAVLALIASSMYLALTGYPVSAVRAYIMISVMFTAVLLDREAVTIRSLMIAAFIILLFRPSSLIEAGFQLSFAATLSLVVCYRYINEYMANRRHKSQTDIKKKNIVISKGNIFLSLLRVVYFIVRKILLYSSGVALSSLIASLATLPFVMYHFHNIMPYGIEANILSAPILSIVVMPMLVMSILLIPLGAGPDSISASALNVAGWGIDYIQSIAIWVGSMPNAIIDVLPLASWAVALMGMGFVMLLLCSSIWKRVIGLLLVVAACLTPKLFKYPDVIVSYDAKHIAVRLQEKLSPSADFYLLVRGKTASNFVVEQWQEQVNLPFRKRPRGAYLSDEYSSLSCDSLGCIYRAGDYKIAISRKVRSLEDDCLLSDIVISSNFVPSHICGNKRSESKLIDPYFLQHNGSVTIYGNDILTSCMVQGVRPWSKYCISHKHKLEVAIHNTIN